MQIMASSSSPLWASTRRCGSGRGRPPQTCRCGFPSWSPPPPASPQCKQPDRPQWPVLWLVRCSAWLGGGAALPAPLDWIGSILEASRVVALATDCPGQGTEHVLVALQAVENVAEIEARPPSQLLLSPVVDVDAIDAREHLPAATAVLLLVVGEQTSDNIGCIRA